MRQTTIAIVLIALLLGGAFWWLRYGRKSAESSVETPSAAEESDVLKRYRELRDLKLDAAILSDPLFRLLERPAVATTTRPAFGRPNPFVPF
ncbi:MAG: hypothetical protein A3B37_01650 [Candidatus Sungbacteria bacterium RIFCSPLOWO2_01_FULL_59_16]|uniref:Uncharacterized protein n=1 Tax=Candidatus Sungbacteria bacterium RIFCSPLOWO2_01_FULL_59_16 TaxID=1802280 RepID=A0A1G2LA01_9BACT|nr:MAG: hypothetical protein A3B37_01650 [Candidatus Sungbacteria bacterium RIFCSPLOWO2_01_FULL_59_16]